MSSTKTHIQSIVSVVEDLGYTFTDEYFDFETFPTSGDNEVYRVEVNTREVYDMSGNRAEKKKRFDLWIAFKLAVGSDRKQDIYNILDAEDELEDEIMQALSDAQLKIVENLMSGIQNDYVIIKLTGDIIFWGTLTA